MWFVCGMILERLPAFITPSPYTTARFYYTLSDSTGKVVTTGNVELTGAKYQDYANKPNHDDRAVVLVMRELNVRQREQRAATQAARQAASATAPKQ